MLFRSDIQRQTHGRWLDVLEDEYSKRYPGYEFALVDVPNLHNPNSNTLLIAQRHA